jgi:hypothetical protein
MTKENMNECIENEFQYWVKEESVDTNKTFIEI